MDALNQFPFYLLPPKKQEMFGMILGGVQHGARFRIGPLANLNYETATQVTFIYINVVFVRFGFDILFCFILAHQKDLYLRYVYA